MLLAIGHMQSVNIRNTYAFLLVFFFLLIYLMNLFERDFLVFTIYKKLNVIMKNIACRAREGQNSFGYQQWHH